MIENELLTAIRSAWSATTASEPDSWPASTPETGHCDVTSLIMREHLGGDLKLAQVFRDGELSEHHYWNVLPDGSEVDLTAGQFDGTEDIVEVSYLDAEFFAAAGPMKPELVRRVDAFRLAVDAARLAAPAR